MLCDSHHHPKTNKKSLQPTNQHNPNDRDESLTDHRWLLMLSHAPDSLATQTDCKQQDKKQYASLSFHGIT
jgi:hypothetical protein